MNILILTFQLLKKYSPEAYPGIARLLDSSVHAWLGGSAFIIRTKMEPEDVLAQVRPHLIKGEFLAVFTASQPAGFFVPEFFMGEINKVLDGEASFEEAQQPST